MAEPEREVRGVRRASACLSARDRATPRALPPHLIYLDNPSVGVRGINHAIAAALDGVPKPTTPPHPQAMDLLARKRAESGRIPVLAIDEARMPGPGQLEAIRMLTNHDLDPPAPWPAYSSGSPPSAAGSSSASSPPPARPSPSATPCRHDPQETTSYISHHLKLTGRPGPLFSDDATALTHATSRGLPRAASSLAIQALIAAYAAAKP